MSTSTDRPDRKPIVALMTANAVSQAGNQMALLAIPWFVLQTTGSAGRVGLAGAVEAAGTIVAALLGGTLVDRIGFRRASILADSGSGIMVALIPLLYRSVGLTFWQLLLLVFLTQVFNTPGATARRSIVLDLIGLAHMSLERASSLNEGIRGFAALGGPLLAGILIAALAAQNVLWIDAATFAFSAALIAIFVPSHTRTRSTEHVPYFAALRDGLRFIRTERVVRAVTFLGTYVNLVMGAFLAVLLPILAKRVYGSSVDFGILFAADGAGTLLGTFLFGVWGDRWSRRATFVVSLVAAFLALTFLATMPPLPLAASLLLIDGMAFGASGPLLFVIYQERTPTELRGRVFGSVSALHRLGEPLGVIAAGYAVQLLSLGAALVGIALLSSGMPLIAAMNPWFRAIERTSGLSAEPITSETG